MPNLLIVSALGVAVLVAIIWAGLRVLPWPFALAGAAGRTPESIARGGVRRTRW